MSTVYLLPQSHAPREDQLSADDRRSLQAHFAPTNFQVVVDGDGIEWGKIEEVEVVKAARERSPAGWIVRNLVFGGRERYHVGIYAGPAELVLINLTLEAARYVVQTIAYYAHNRIKYSGPDGLSATSEA